MPDLVTASGRAVLSGSYDPASSALFAAMTTSPTPARKKLIDNLVRALKRAGIWTSLDCLYVLAAADSQAARLNWVSPSTFTALAVNSPTFAADLGYMSDGATSRLRTQYTPSANGVNFTLNDASVWTWNRTEGQSSVRDVGNATSPTANIISRNLSDAMSGTINDATNDTRTNTVAIGLAGAQRVSSSTKRLWMNGVQLGADLARASTALAAQEQWMCGANATSFSVRQCAGAAWGASLAGKESAFYSALFTYMQAVGAA